MKYFKISYCGLPTNIIIAVEDDKVEEARQKYDKYELTETEAPKDAEIISSNPRPIVLKPQFPDVGFANERRVYWDGPCCARCKNKYKGTSDWCLNHHNDQRCYRFNLER